jgi:hypothetical protein
MSAIRCAARNATRAPLAAGKRVLAAKCGGWRAGVGTDPSAAFPRPLSSGLSRDSCRQASAQNDNHPSSDNRQISYLAKGSVPPVVFPTSEVNLPVDGSQPWFRTTPGVKDGGYLAGKTNTASCQLPWALLLGRVSMTDALTCPKRFLSDIHVRRDSVKEKGRCRVARSGRPPLALARSVLGDFHHSMWLTTYYG